MNIVDQLSLYLVFIILVAPVILKKQLNKLSLSIITALSLVLICSCLYSQVNNILSMTFFFTLASGIYLLAIKNYQKDRYNNPVVTGIVFIYKAILLQVTINSLIMVILIFLKETNFMTVLVILKNPIVYFIPVTMIAYIYFANIYYKKSII